MRYIVAYVSRLTGREGVIARWLTKYEAKDLVETLHGQWLGYEYWFEKI